LALILDIETNVNEFISKTNAKLIPWVAKAVFQDYRTAGLLDGSGISGFLWLAFDWIG